MVVASSTIRFARPTIRCFCGWFLKRGRNWSALIVTQENLDSSFGLAEPLLAFAREPDALLKQLQTLFQRQVAVFQLPHDLFERFKRSFERAALFFALFHLSITTRFALRLLEQRTVCIKSADSRQLLHHIINDALDQHVVFEISHPPTFRVTLHRKFDRALRKRSFDVCSIACSRYSHQTRHCHNQQNKRTRLRLRRKILELFYDLSVNGLLQLRQQRRHQSVNALLN